jgi:hypothetical protein
MAFASLANLFFIKEGKNAALAICQRDVYVCPSKKPQSGE